MADKGIAARHRLRCRARQGATCNCKPSYQVNVWSRRDRKRLWKTFPTRAAARSWQVDAKQGLRKGTLRAPTAVTLREEAAAWLEGARRGEVSTRSGRPFKPSALRSYETALNRRILPELGGERLSAITHIDLQHFVDRLRVTPVDPQKPELGSLDPSTIKNTLVPLRSIFRHALKRGRIAVNPTAGLDLPTAEGRRERIASPGEATELLDALAAWPSTGSDVALWATAMYAGLRRGELQALRWQDVDLGKGVIRVQGGWDAKTGLIETKSRAGTRTVPVGTVLRSHLLQHHLRAGRPETGFAFGRPTGEPFSPSSVRLRALTAWANDNKRRQQHGEALLPPIGFHECRHTFASLMIAAGVNAKALSTYLGHSSVQLTFDLYGHLMPGNEAQAASLLDSYLQASENLG